MAWILSFLTVAGNFLVGRKSKWGWLVFLVGGPLWVYYALAMKPPQYGLLPAIFLNTLIAATAAVRWFREPPR